MRPQCYKARPDSANTFAHKPSSKLPRLEQPHPRCLLTHSQARVPSAQAG